MKKLLIIAIACVTLGFVADAADLSRVQIGAGFGSTQARVLNNVISETETAINTAVLVDTNVTTVVTNYTATVVGQLLIGGAGTGTNSLWYASDTTATNWVQLSIIAP